VLGVAELPIKDFTQQQQQQQQQHQQQQQQKGRSNDGQTESTETDLLCLWPPPLCASPELRVGTRRSAEGPEDLAW